MVKKELKLTISILFLLICASGFAQEEVEDWPNLNRYAEQNEKLEPPAPGEDRVVFMGNSITEGWGFVSPDFFSDNPYVNRGISGQTTPQMLIRFRPDVIGNNPAVVVILAGTNDIAGNTGPVTLEMIMDNIKSMTDLALQNDIKVILCSVLPANHYYWSPDVEPADKIVALNTQIKRYALERGVIYLDYYTSMVDQEKGLKSEYSRDGVHPTKEGFMVMEPLVKAAIGEALNAR
jgi:lysophospholipase L1-like esterase